MEVTRRFFLRGAGAVLVAAPAIVKVSSLMPVKAWPAEITLVDTLYDEEFARALMMTPLQYPGPEMTAHEVKARIAEHCRTVAPQLFAGIDELASRALDRACQFLDVSEGPAG